MFFQYLEKDTYRKRDFQEIGFSYLVILVLIIISKPMKNLKFIFSKYQQTSFTDLTKVKTNIFSGYHKP